MNRRVNYSRYETHLTFFMVGLCSMIVHSIVDLESFILLRYLGSTSYDAQTISFFLRRFNLIIGIILSVISLFFTGNIACSEWHWLLFSLYFLVTFYIYLLSNNVIHVGKFALIPISLLSLVSHGLLISTIRYIFEGFHVKYDKQTNMALLIFISGCFSSGFLVKILLQLSGDITDDESYSGLKLFNRLFILFTVVNLISSFLLGRLPPNENNTTRWPNKALNSVLYSRSRWVFFMGCVGFSFSPMMNNLTLSVVNSLSPIQAFNLEYIQFCVCSCLALFLYILVSTGIMSIGRGEIRSETLYDVISSVLNVNNQSNPDLVIEDGILEDLASNEALNLRLFRGIQPWCYLQYGFWTVWENYDSVDHFRLMNVVSVNMLVGKIRGGFRPIQAELEDREESSQDLFLQLLDAKYQLLWNINCFIKQCQDLMVDLYYIFHTCDCQCKDNCCKEGGTCNHSVPATSSSSDGKGGCLFLCLKNVLTNVECMNKCFKDKLTEELKVVGEDCIACNVGINSNLNSFVYGILCTCANESKKLLDDIGDDPDLDDGLKIDKSLELSLIVLEQFLPRFLAILVYARIADEILLLFKEMKNISFNLTQSVVQYICQNRCQCLSKEEEKKKKEKKEGGTEEVVEMKCRCMLYLKFIKICLLLHERQRKTCLIITGKSRDSLAIILPTLSMTRSVSLFSSFFKDFIASPFLSEKANCKCPPSRGTNCGCCGYSSRVDDLLDMMLKGLEYLSEFDGILSIIIFFLSYLKEFELYPITAINSGTTSGDSNNNSANGNAGNTGREEEKCTCCRTTGTTREGCQCGTGTGQTKKHCISCLCCGKLTKGHNCQCNSKQTGEKCCLCCVFCKKCNKGGAMSCCQSQQESQVQEGQAELCCKTCCTECPCCRVCYCKCVCCTLKRRKKDTKDMSAMLKFSENSKRNLILVATTRKTMVLQSMADFMLKSNLFKDVYKNLNESFVQNSFFTFYLVSCFVVYLFCVIGDVIPYIQNIPTIPKLTFLFVIFSLIIALSIVYPMMYLADFGPESAVIINLLILISMVVCIIWSWTTHWLSYRVLLYQQFQNFYNKFRMVYTGGVNVYQPGLSWWFEGLISFVKTDFHTMYLLICLKNFGENYDPFSFGFTRKLQVNYNLLQTLMSPNSPYGEENMHIITNEEFRRNMESVLLDPHNFGPKFTLDALLDYRAFQLIPEDSYYFLSDVDEIKHVTYSADMLHNCWVNNILMTRAADRLQFLREHALRCVEIRVQDEVKANNYDRDSIKKLKKYFDFRSEILNDLANNCVFDARHHGDKLNSIQSATLVSIYELEYRKRWDSYLKRTVFDEVPPEGTYTPLKANVLSKKFKRWRENKMKVCDQVYGGSLICKSIVSRTSDEFEIALNDAEDPIDAFMDLMSKGRNIEDSSDEITKYLSYVSKTGDVIELNKVKLEISNLILKDTGSSKYFGSLLKGYVSVCRNMHQESTMYNFVTRNNEVIIGEWIRWQGQYINSDIIKMFSKFSAVDSNTK